MSLGAIFALAEAHARSCRRCCRPIVADEEGNPGPRSEACAEGAAILDAWEAEEYRILGVSLPPRKGKDR